MQQDLDQKTIPELLALAVSRINSACIHMKRLGTLDPVRADEFQEMNDRLTKAAELEKAGRSREASEQARQPAGELEALLTRYAPGSQVGELLREACDAAQRASGRMADRARAGG